MIVAWLLAGFSLMAGLLMAFIVLTIELFLVASDRRRLANTCSTEPDFVTLIPEKRKKSRFVEKVTTNTIDMYASVRGIAGNAIGTVKALELNEPEKENNND